MFPELARSPLPGLCATSPERLAFTVWGAQRKPPAAWRIATSNHARDMIPSDRIYPIPPTTAKGEVMDDAYDVLSALRLGWSVAEMRGRNRPDGPPGEVLGMPDHVDHPLAAADRAREDRAPHRDSVRCRRTRPGTPASTMPPTAPVTAPSWDTRPCCSPTPARPRRPTPSGRPLPTSKKPSRTTKRAQALTSGLAAQQAVVTRRRQALCRGPVLAGPGSRREPRAGVLRRRGGLFAALEQAHQWRGLAGHRAASGTTSPPPPFSRGPIWPNSIWQFDAHVQDRLAALVEPGHRLPAGPRPGRHVLGAESGPGGRLGGLELPARRTALRGTGTADGQAGRVHGGVHRARHRRRLEVWKTVVTTLAVVGPG